MRAYNVVRFKVKPGREEEFLAMHREDPALPGFLGGAVVKTGDRSYCFIGEWDGYERIIAARSKMIGMLDRIRDTLEDLGGGLGVTDPISGEVAVDLPKGPA